MSWAGDHLTARRLVLGVAATVAVGATAGATLDADPGPERPQPAASAASLGAGAGIPGAESSAVPSPCGPASAATIAAVDATVAQGIYTAEIHSHEVSADVAHITSARSLLGALASNNEAAVHSAVHAIVYTPHWHIVRLRVVKAGHVLADVGGPDIIAPVSGPLRWRGRTVGTYVMSVQDDVGYVKLVSRFIGVPVDLYSNGSFLMGTLQPAPSKVSDGASVTVGGNAFTTRVLSARAFPDGALRIGLFVPKPTPAVASASCAAVRVAEWGNIARHVAARFKPLTAHYQDLVDVLRGTTGGFAYVRSGSTRIAGGSGPSQIPQRGTVRYRGRTWSVFSWEPSPPARVYVLIPLA